IKDMVLEEIELIELDNEEFSREEFLKGNLSPAFWGSAKLNFGVDQFLEYFTKWAPAPGVRKTLEGQVDPMDNYFSGFVFKIQANMDKKHRDRMAFMRICSGKFERGMKVKHMRLNREVRLSHSAQFLAQDRETVEAAYAGDIVGLSDPGLFRIGDSVTSGKKLQFEKIPQFSPELFTRLHVKDAMKRQKLQKAVKELSEEGVIQIFIDPHIGAQDPVIGVVGELQFEVLKHRLEEEYNLEARLDRAPFSVARWPRDKEGKPVEDIKGATIVFRDKDERPVVLLGSEWDINWLQRENEDVIFGSPFRLCDIAIV
ncbi:MAG: peptide chain release factor 3, partial [Bdellovibrionales bacterium]|nr:peptide chain release factor 3 [Bdellovibrionales bacterium]